MVSMTFHFNGLFHKAGYNGYGYAPSQFFLTACIKSWPDVGNRNRDCHGRHVGVPNGYTT